MPVASGSRAQLAYILESVYGTTPATPVFKVLPDSRESVGLEKETFESERVRSDRQIVDFRHGSRSAAGEIPFEFCRDNYDDMLQAALMGTWAADTPAPGQQQLKAGIVRRSFTFETHFQDVGRWKRSVGCEVASLSMEVTPNAMVTGTLTLVGQDSDITSAAVAGSTYTPAPVTRIYDSFSGSMVVNGVTVASITSISLALENGIENQPVVGSNLSIQGAAGRSNLTGEIGAFFFDSSLYDLFDDETEIDISFELNDGHTSYLFEMPRCILNGGKPEVADDREISVSIPFQALYDATDASQIVITKTVL